MRKPLIFNKQGRSRAVKVTTEVSAEIPKHHIRMGETRIPATGVCLPGYSGEIHERPQMSYESELVLRFFTVIPNQAIKRILKDSVPSKKTLNVCQTNVNIH